MDLKKGIRPGTEQRCALLKFCLEKGMPTSMMLPISAPMRGKAEEEKEQIAEEALIMLHELECGGFFSMEKVSQKYEKRNRLLNFCLENGISYATIAEMVKPMDGKTEAEKEQIAEALLNKLQGLE